MSSSLPNITAVPSPQGCDVSVNTAAAVTRLRVNRDVFFPQRILKENQHMAVLAPRKMCQGGEGEDKALHWIGKQRRGAEGNVRSDLEITGGVTERVIAP